jgi:UPF0148 protein
MDEDEVLSKITRLLERGCTMLATHHDCGAPLFRCQGDVVCPVCSFEQEPLPLVRGPTTDAGRSKEEEKTDPGRAQSPHVQRSALRLGVEEDQSDRSVGDDAQIHSAMEGLEAVLLLRLQELTASLRDEQDLDKLKRLLDCLEALLRVQRSL